MIEYGSLILYLSLFTVSFLFLSFSFNGNRIITILVSAALAIPILLATFRYGVGTDYFNYMRSFFQYKDTTIVQQIKENSVEEIGRFIILKAGSILNSYQISLGIYSTLSVVIIYFALRNHKKKVLIGIGFFIYLCIYYPSSLNLMSQFVAVSIIAYSFKFIFENRFHKFLILVIFASLFHTTALIVLPVYFLWDHKKNSLVGKWKVLIVVLLCVLFPFYYQTIIGYLSNIDQFSEYAVYANDNSRGQNRDLIFKVILLLIVLILRKPLIKYDNRNKLYILLIVFNFIIGITGFTSPWVKRVSLYFEITQIFLIPSVIQLFKNRKEKIIVYLGTFAYAIIYFILVYYILNNSNIIPYRFSF